MDDAGTITAIATGAVVFVVGLVKAILKLVEDAKKRRTVAPPPLVISPHASEDTGSFMLAEALQNDSIAGQLERIQRGLTMVLRNGSNHAQLDAIVTATAETIDAMSRLLEVSERRAVERDREIIERVTRLEHSVEDRDMRIVGEVLERTRNGE